METATNTQATNLVENPPSPLTYEFLREEGLKHIRALGGNLWSDHNVGDPGITMLEVLCVAIADISSRISLDVKELIANPKGELYDNIYPPAEILPCYPLTTTDFRKLLIDLPEVKNAWIEPDSTAAIYHNRITQNVSLAGPKEQAGPNQDKVPMKGLYTVFIEKEEGKTSEDTEIVDKVTGRLEEHRNLCEVFSEIKVLDPQEIAIKATLEIGAVSDVAQLLAKVYAKLDRFISPRVRFYTLQELLDNGKRIDEIMEGPRLANGFIDTQALERYTNKKQLRSSDLIQEIMDVPGVTLVKHIQMHARKSNLENQDTSENQANLWDDPASWILPLDTAKAPKLIEPGQGKNKITLIQGSVTVAINWDTVKDKYNKLREAPASSSTKTQDFKLGKNRVSELGKYDSIQNNFPNIYGVGKYGLSESASRSRKAQAKQLKAYLLFFDQLLANYLSQLANVKDLFAYDKANAKKVLKTYFAQNLFEVVPNIDTLISSTDYEKVLSVWHEDSSDEDKATARARKNSFLNHLMARFGEKFNEYALLQYTNQQETTQNDVENDEENAKSDPALKAKYDFLQNYPTVSSQRATEAGLQQRIRIQLGLTDAETFDMIEHITLRPPSTKRRAFFTFARPLYLEPDTPDTKDKDPPYIICHSLNHGLEAGDVIVVRDSVYYQGIYKVETVETKDRQKDKDKFKVKQQANFKFPKALDAGQWYKYGTHRDPFSLQLSFVFPTAQNERFSNKAFQTYAQEVIRAETPAHIKVYVHWLDDTQMGIVEKIVEKLEKEKDEPAQQDTLSKVAILENPLNLGRVPWEEPEANLVFKRESESATGDITFTIGNKEKGSEKDITYYVRNEKTGEPLEEGIGEGENPITITIPAYKISNDTTFDILALNKDECVGVELIQVAPRYAVVIAGNRAEIVIENSQEGTIYELVGAHKDTIIWSDAPEAGTGEAISLWTIPLTTDITSRIRTTSRSGTKTYKKDIDVKLLRTDLVVVPDPIVFSEMTANIKIEESQKMVKYELEYSTRGSQPSTAEGKPLTAGGEPITADGTGSEDAITLTTPELTESRKFKIKATPIKDETLPSTPSSTKFQRDKDADLDMKPTIEVHPQYLSLIPEYPLPVHVGFPANLKLKKSYKGVNYQLKSAERSTELSDDKPIRKSVEGTGDKITLTTNVGLQKDTPHVQVFATIKSVERPVLKDSTTLYVVYPKSSIVLPQQSRSNSND